MTSLAQAVGSLPEPYYDHAGCTIYHGDCRDILPCVRADVVVTDPPYAVSESGVRHVGNKGRGARRFDFFKGDCDHETMTQTVLDAARMILGASSIYFWCGHRQIGRLIDVFESAGKRTRPLVWVKPYPTPAPPGVGWPSAAELCVYAWDSGRVPMPRGRDAPRSNVFVADTFRNGKPGKWPHPTQKPLSIMSEILRVSSSRDCLVLDPFMGSGTTLRAAKDLGRRSIGIEIEERYCEIAAKRLSQEVLDL